MFLTLTGLGVSMTDRRFPSAVVSLVSPVRDDDGEGSGGGTTSLRGEFLAELESVGCKKLALESLGCENRAFMLLTFTLSGVSILGSGEEGVADRARGEMACFPRSGELIFC
jgi:hypothetical protein